MVILVFSNRRNYGSRSNRWAVTGGTATVMIARIFAVILYAFGTARAYGIGAFATTM